MTEYNPKNKYELIKKYLEEHQSDYSSFEKKDILNNATSELTSTTPDFLRQIMTELKLIDDDQNIYQAFADLVSKNFGLDKNIIEVGGGIIPSLSKIIALRQKNGTITVYDPRLTTSKIALPNLILKKERFTKKTNLANTDLLIGFMPCEATEDLIESATENSLDFMIALCECGPHQNQEFLESTEEWHHYLKYSARNAIRKNNMGSLNVTYLDCLQDTPILYNKR